jgi:hypothetical protein
MASDVQTMLASTAPIVPFDLALSCRVTSLTVMSAFMPLPSPIWFPAVRIEMSV